MSRKHVSHKEREAIEKSLPAFRLRTKAEYEQLAQAARASGEDCSWADVRVADLLAQFPKADDIADTASVRAVYLWYLAYQRQLTADLDSEEAEVVEKAKREIERIVSKKLVQRFDRVRGGKT
jgi:hypothetical protein